MKGIKNVETEFGLLAMVHNLLKMMKNRVFTLFFVFIQKKNHRTGNYIKKSGIKKEKRERREKGKKR